MSVALALSLAAALAAPAAPAKAAPAKADFGAALKQGSDLWATFETSKGKIVVKLFTKDAPETVANFVGLATGTKAWTDPKTRQKMEGKPLYDGTVFHRVIPGFMIQGGDPLGNGTGTPGFDFKDEFQSGRKFDKVGLLAMANRGPNTNGSQFFITVSTPHHLDNRHTIFGEVVEGYPVVEAIANAPRGMMDRPNETLTLERVVIADKAPGAAEAPKAKPAKKSK